MHKTLYVYPWDLADEGAANVAERARDLGLDGLAVATTYHAGKFIRPHAPTRKTYFTEDGAVCFRPDLTRYGRIKPMQTGDMRLLDTLTELHRAAPEMRLLGWTVGLHNSRQGVLNPDLVARTAFGDGLVNALCPSQPEVRANLVALAVDIGDSQPVREIILETPGWQPYRHGHHHEFELIEMGAEAQAMLSLCFCEACRVWADAADVDLTRSGRRRALRSRHSLRTGRGCSTRKAILVGPHFWSGRTSAVTSLMAEIRAALNSRVALAVLPTVQSPKFAALDRGQRHGGVGEGGGPAGGCGVSAGTPGDSRGHCGRARSGGRRSEDRLRASLPTRPPSAATSG